MNKSILSGDEQKHYLRICYCQDRKLWNPISFMFAFFFFSFYLFIFLFNRIVIKEMSPIVFDVQDEAEGKRFNVVFLSQ